MKIFVFVLGMIFCSVSVVLFKIIKKHLEFFEEYVNNNPDGYRFRQAIKKLMKLTFFYASSLLFLLGSIIYILITYFSK